eukprot:gene10702-biopygen12344
MFVLHPRHHPRARAPDLAGGWRTLTGAGRTSSTKMDTNWKVPHSSQLTAHKRVKFHYFQELKRWTRHIYTATLPVQTFCGSCCDGWTLAPERCRWARILGSHPAGSDAYRAHIRPAPESFVKLLRRQSAGTERKCGGPAVNPTVHPLNSAVKLPIRAPISVLRRFYSISLWVRAPVANRSELY